MNMRIFKKLSTLSASLIVLGMLPLQALYADDSGVSNGLLQQIVNNTASNTNKTQVVANKVDDVIASVSGLPNYIKQMVEDFIPVMKAYAANMTAEDKSDATKALQSELGTVNSYIANDINAQDNLFLGTKDKPGMLDELMVSGNSQDDIPNAAGLFYSTMLGHPIQLPVGVSENGKQNSPEEPLKDPQLSFLKNASGFNISHKAPGNIGGPNQDAVKRYINYYRTVMPVQSYNTYILSKLYVQSANQRALQTAQMNLAAKVGGSDWIANISGIEIGKVIRQILLFESQSYLLMTQMLETQRQMLTAQAMTNSVLIAGFQLNEKELLKEAMAMPRTQ